MVRIPPLRVTTGMGADQRRRSAVTRADSDAARPASQGFILDPALVSPHLKPVIAIRLNKINVRARRSEACVVTDFPSQRHDLLFRQPVLFHATTCGTPVLMLLTVRRPTLRSIATSVRQAEGGVILILT